jgi:transcriptional regulator with XRE-family HTH domain
MIVKTPESQGQCSKTAAQEVVSGSDRLPVVSRRVLAKPSELRVKKPGDYDCHNPLDIEDLDWIDFYDGAESDPALQELVPIRGENIRASRMVNNFSGEAIAEVLGVSQKAYQKMDSGETRRISLVRAATLCLLLNQPPEAIILDNDDTKRVTKLLAEAKVDEEALAEIRKELKSDLPIKPRCSASEAIMINGKLLRAKRIERGLSQVEIGQRLDYSEASIWRLETSTNYGISNEKLITLAALLGVEPGALLKSPGDVGQK